MTDPALVRVTISTMDGEVLEQFVATSSTEQEIHYSTPEIEMGHRLREFIEAAFETEEL